MGLLLNIKRLCMRVRRLPHSKGFGIQSPFAFDYTTKVLLGATSKADARALELKELEAAKAEGMWQEEAETRKVRRLLFRMVRHARPAKVIAIGPKSPALPCLQAGNEAACVRHMREWGEWPEAWEEVDFAYLNDFSRPRAVYEDFVHLTERTKPASIVVVLGIGYTSPMKEAWRKMTSHPSVGVTFDLFDVGVLMFDKTLYKQDYIVNF